MNFEQELEALVKKAVAAGQHGMVIAQALVKHAHDAVAHEADIVRRHNPQLFSLGKDGGDQLQPSDAKGG